MIRSQELPKSLLSRTISEKSQSSDSYSDNSSKNSKNNPKSI
jgi:hypothetical protein